MFRVSPAKIIRAVVNVLFAGSVCAARLEGQTTALTYFFDRTTIDGNHLTFTTKPVHDIWYSFDGSIVRSDVPAKQETGFYRLKGSWVMHADAGKTQSTSMVSFRSTPRSE